MSQKSISELVLQMNQLTVTEMLALAKEMEEAWGVSASPASSLTGAVAMYGSIAPPRNDELQVVLVGTQEGKRISVMKELRKLLSMELNATKELMLDLPQTIGQWDRTEANHIADALKAAGAEITQVEAE